MHDVSICHPVISRLFKTTGRGVIAVNKWRSSKKCEWTVHITSVELFHFIGICKSHTYVSRMSDSICSENKKSMKMAANKYLQKTTLSLSTALATSNKMPTQKTL